MTRPDDLDEAVLAVVEQIPAGRVMSYGAIARYLSEAHDVACSARQVGRVMGRAGASVPWHRVVMADGKPPIGHAQQALQLLAAEGTPLRGGVVVMATAAWWPDGDAFAHWR